MDLVVMEERLFSPHWYQIAELKAKLCSHCEINCHQYRGDTWYLIQDKQTGRYNRFNAQAYQVIAHLDGAHSLDKIWHELTEALGDDAPSQDDIIQLLGILHQLDLLIMDMTPDIEEILQRKKSQQQKKIVNQVKNPLSIRLPLINPNRFLNRWYCLVRPLFSKAAFVLFSMLICFALLLTIKHWADLNAAAQAMVLNPAKILLILLCYPLVKVLHELGHGFAVKHFGGEVHEMGIMFMVFAPIPYVDASEASFFKSKQQRMIVSGAGIIVELLLSALALMIWLNLHDGMVRDFVLTIMVIGGVSTLLFNGNPLLRFDGYYVLADAIEFPDLAKRANQYYFYLIQYYLFGIDTLRSPARTLGEHAWLATYGVASFVFRIVILALICYFVASHFFIIGILLALWLVLNQLCVPLMKGFIFLLRSPLLRRRRQRAIAVITSIFVGLLLLTSFVPVPFNNLVTGIVWLPEQAYIRAETDGFIETLLVEEGQYVTLGTPLITLANPSLLNQLQQLEAKEEALQIQYTQARDSDWVEADSLQQEIKTLNAEIEDLSKSIQSLTIKSHDEGYLAIPDSQNLMGQYVRQGDSLAYLLRQGGSTVRIVVPQSMIALIRDHSKAIEVRLSSCISCVIPAVIDQEIPSGLNKLPSKALGYQGGGQIATDPDDSSGLNTLEPYFQFELRLLNDTPLPGQQLVGQRAYVRIVHAWEPLATQWYRMLRQLLLTKSSMI